MLDHLLSTNHRSGLTLCFSSKKRVWKVVWSICCSWNSCRNNYRTSTLKADPKHQSFFCYPKKCWNKRRSDLEKCQPPKKTANIILDELRSSLVFHARIVVVLGFEANFFLGGNQDWRWKKTQGLTTFQWCSGSIGLLDRQARLASVAWELDFSSGGWNEGFLECPRRVFWAVFSACS